MGDRLKSSTMDDLPLHLILEILTSGRLSAADLVCLELTSRTFWGSHGLFSEKFRSLVDFAAFRLCGSHPIYSSLRNNAQSELYNRCNGNWKRVLRFLQSVEQSSHMVETAAGNMQIKSGRYHTLLINDSGVYSCGSSLCGVLGHGQETTQCVFTCGDNSSFCCGHRETSRPIFRPKLVEALKNIPCKQVAAGLSFTMFLTCHGLVYTCGLNAHGQLGHGDTQDRPTPQKVELLECIASVVQIAAGPSYGLAVADDGTLFSFGSGTISALDMESSTMSFSLEQFYHSRGRGFMWFGYLLVMSMWSLLTPMDMYIHGAKVIVVHWAMEMRLIRQPQHTLPVSEATLLCSKRKTFVLLDNGSVYGFGWMGFGSLGFPDRGVSDKVVKPRVLDSLRGHHISQVSTGLYHTVVVTNQGQVLGFGDNERAQLGHDTLRGCLEPTEIFIEETEGNAQQ
ncbi:UNVERIFIED_CONTAM: Ultraviolet-B receptor UVR8 [Sesamum calycinum]|uniref:Ultraviolet-B receptor UVR8 n=1 Tax=Sesamum calycinum TaxID=2727403 RepID=A0AAW2Q4Q5_9LAMI